MATVRSQPFSALPGNLQSAIRANRSAGVDVAFSNGAAPTGFSRSSARSSVSSYAGFTPYYRSGYSFAVESVVNFWDMAAGTGAATVGAAMPGGGFEEKDDHGGFNVGNFLTTLVTGASNVASAAVSAGQPRTMESQFVPTRGQIPWGLVGIGGLALVGLFMLRGRKG